MSLASGAGATACLILVLGVTSAAAVGSETPAGPRSKTCHGERATIVGTAESETLRGTPGRDIIVAGRGKDVVKALEGNDLVCGGRGADVLWGGSGNDRVLAGKSGKVCPEGECFPDPDVLNGGRGDDRLRGGAGQDKLVFPGATGGIHAVLAADRVAGQGIGTDTVDGTAEIVVATGHDDWLVGDAGNNTLYGGAGLDTVRGQAGDDVLAGGDDRDAVRGEAGDDRLDGGHGDDVVGGGSGADFLSENWQDDGANEFYGGGGRDIIQPTGTGSLVHGGGGNDKIESYADLAEIGGGGGDDYLQLYSSAVSEEVRGGDGEDVLHVVAPRRGVDVNLAEHVITVPFRARIWSTEQIWTFVPYSPWEDRADVIVGSGAAETFRTGGGDDQLSGRGGDDVLRAGENFDGPEDADTARGGPGQDRCVDAETSTSCETG